MSNLLIDENPLQVLPTLACHLGLNEAMFLQQIHYWIRTYGKTRDGFLWTYNSYPQWQKQFPFWSVETIKRIVLNLENKKILITGNYNKQQNDRTKWYRIDYENLEQSCKIARPSGQFDPTMRSSCPHHEVNLTRPLPETISETISETNDASPDGLDSQTGEISYSIKKTAAKIFPVGKKESSAKNFQSENVFNIGEIEQRVKDKHIQKFLNKELNSREAFSYYAALRKEHGYSNPGLTPTEKELGMCRTINKFLSNQKITIQSYLQFTIGRWKDLRAMVTWEGSKKSRLGEQPTLSDLCVSREVILQAWLVDKKIGRKEDSLVTITRLEDIPKNHPNYTKLAKMLKTNGAITLRKFT